MIINFGVLLSLCGDKFNILFNKLCSYNINTDVNNVLYYNLELLSLIY